MARRTTPRGWWCNLPAACDCYDCRGAQNTAPRVHPDVAAHEAEVYKQKRNARAAKRGGLR